VTQSFGPLTTFIKRYRDFWNELRLDLSETLTVVNDGLRAIPLPVLLASENRAIAGTLGTAVEPASLSAMRAVSNSLVSWVELLGLVRSSRPIAPNLVSGVPPGTALEGSVIPHRRCGIPFRRIRPSRPRTPSTTKG
jgi:hypothetical protein